MSKIDFSHGGKEFDDKYPLGIPTQMTIETDIQTKGEIIMFPSGHARNDKCNLKDILQHKFAQLASIALQSNANQQNINKMISSITNLRNKDIFLRILIP